MCGIAALIDPSRRATLSDLVAMTEVIRHRGPDSEGFAVVDGRDVGRFYGADTTPDVIAEPTPYQPQEAAAADPGAHGWAVLGHRRLSILDLSPHGHQPMVDESGRFWMVFNGEIYNFVELRRELEARGRRFTTTSDSEVLLASYAEWGPQCLERFAGMFAVVIVDIEAQRVLVARDRFGIKPLYFWRRPDGALAFASEIKQFTTQPGWSARMNGRRVYDFLNYSMTDHTSESMFDGVHQLRGGEMIYATVDELRTDVPVRRWWSLEPKEFTGDFDEAAQEFRRLFELSITEHLRSDVPIGSCLSGGLDSSSIVCVVNEQIKAAGSDQPQIAFSATSDDPNLDESKWMRLVGDHTGVPFVAKSPLMSDVPGLLPRITWHMDEPFGSTSILAQWTVFEMAAHNQVKVMLDGQGADEQLAGYTPYFAWRYQELLRRGRLIELSREIQGARASRPEGMARLAMLTAYLSLPQWLGRLGGRMVGAPGQDPDSWINLETLGVEGHPDPLHESGGTSPSVRGLSLSQLMSTNLPALLRYEDRDSMAHSIEARVPFLDHRLVEFVVSLPSEFLISRGVTKRVMRTALSGTLPNEIRDRKDKIGFATAEQVWMQQSEPEVARRMVQNSIDVSQGVLRPESISRVDAMIAGTRAFDYSHWRKISLGAWIEAFDVKA